MTKQEFLPISDPQNVPVTFVNQVVARGVLNGIVNVTLAVAQFTPTPEGKVDPDLVIASRLRMDLFCAVQLRDALDALIKGSVAPDKEPIESKPH